MSISAESTVTHAYLDARLEAVETRIDARIERIEIKMDAFEQRMDQFAHSMQQMQQSIHDVRKETHDAIGNLQTQMTQQQTENAKLFASMKSYILVTAISTVVAIVLGVAAFNSSVVGNVTTAFDSGRQAAAALARIEAQQTQHELQDQKMQVQRERHDKLLQELAQWLKQPQRGR